MNLVLNNLHKVICHKTLANKQTKLIQVSRQLGVRTVKRYSTLPKLYDRSFILIYNISGHSLRGPNPLSVDLIVPTDNAKSSKVPEYM